MPLAILVHEHGGSEVLRLEDHDPGEPGPGSVRIRVSASGVNFIDVYMRSGLYPRPTPFVLGLEGAGVVEAIGPSTEGLAEGDRVAWSSVAGSYAEILIAPVDRLVHVPEAVSDPVAAASWFRGKVDFPVQASRLGLKQASFQGARLSNVREHQAAHMTYMVDGHRVTLMIFNRQRTILKGGRQVSVKGKDVLLGTRNGFNVAVLLDGDIAYALSSDLSQERLLSLVSHL